MSSIQEAAFSPSALVAAGEFADSAGMMNEVIGMMAAGFNLTGLPIVGTVLGEVQRLLNRAVTFGRNNKLANATAELALHLGEALKQLEGMKELQGVPSVAKAIEDAKAALQNHLATFEKHQKSSGLKKAVCADTFSKVLLNVDLMIIRITSALALALTLENSRVLHQRAGEGSFAAAAATSSSGASQARISQLEAEVSQLKAETSQLRQQLEMLTAVVTQQGLRIVEIERRQEAMERTVQEHSALLCHHSVVLGDIYQCQRDMKPQLDEVRDYLENRADGDELVLAHQLEKLEAKVAKKDLPPEARQKYSAAIASLQKAHDIKTKWGTRRNAEFKQARELSRSLKRAADKLAGR